MWGEEIKLNYLDDRIKLLYFCLENLDVCLVCSWHDWNNCPGGQLLETNFD